MRRIDAAVFALLVVEFDVVFHQTLSHKSIISDRNELSSVPTGMWHLTNLQDLNLGEKSRGNFSCLVPYVGTIVNSRRLFLPNLQVKINLFLLLQILENSQT